MLRNDRSPSNRIVLLTVSVVVLAGVLSGAGTFIQIRRTTQSYDAAIETELQQKGYGIASTANFFLQSLGPGAVANLQDFATDAFSLSENVEEGRTDTGSRFDNVFLKLEVWSDTASGFALAYDEELADGRLGKARRGNPEVVASVAQSDIPTSTIDEGEEVLDIYVPFELDRNTRLVLIGTLDAHDEFAFFAAQNRAITRNGIIFSVAITVIVSLVGAGLSLLVARTLTSRRRVEEGLREQARRDPLTGALNHGAIVDELRRRTQETRQPLPFAVVMADVDGMKATNDTFGHPVGDRVLRTVARALETDGSILGRYGGDEFVAVLPGADEAAALSYQKNVATQLSLATVADPQTGTAIPVSLSLGVSFFPGDASSVLDLINVSDNAMYAARRERPVITPPGQMPLRRQDDAAARIVAELIPLLVEDGALDSKLAQLARRLCTGGGYEAVNIALYGEPDEPTISHTVGRGVDDFAAEWDQVVGSGGGQASAIRTQLETGKRPLILNDVDSYEPLGHELRELLQKAGIQSAVVAPMLWQGQPLGSIGIASREPNAFGPRDAQFLASVATQVTAIVRMAKLVDDLKATTGRLVDAQEETVMLLAAAAEAHEPGMQHHFQGVRWLAEKLALQLGYEEDQARELGLAAALHDVGKIRVSHEALSNAGPLSSEQWEEMQRHTTWGESFLSGHPGFALAATVARSHHERWSGGGYPDSLVGEEIAEVASIVSVADAFDAMTKARSYDGARTPDQAIAEIVAASGTQFCPRIVHALVQLYDTGALEAAQMEKAAA